MSKIIICGDFKSSDVTRVSVSEQLIKLFSEAQLCICNFEVPIRGYGKPIKKSGPVHCQDTKAPGFLKKMGFSLFLTANNHIMDYGKEGCEATLGALGRNNTVGAGYAYEAYSMKVRNINGKTIGVLSFVQYEFGVVEHPLLTEEYGAAWIASLAVEEIIRTSKEQVDYLIVCPHAGVENTIAPLPEWRTIYRAFVDWGADLVVASHPHVPQGWELYKDRYIFYSLGDFYFDKFDGKKYFNTSLVVEIDVDKGYSVKTHIISFVDHHLDFSNDLADERFIDKCVKLLLDEKKYYSYINEMCASIYKGNIYGILRGVGGTSLRVKPKLFVKLFGGMLINNTDEMYLLNAFRCESHRWVIQRALKNKNNSL